MTTFKRIAKPDETSLLPRRRRRQSAPPTCNHIRPRRCCMACRAFFTKQYGEEKGVERFNQSLDAWNRRLPRVATDHETRRRREDAERRICAERPYWNAMF